MEYGQARIVGTTGDLATLAESFPAATPVQIDVEEIEPGHEPGNSAGWAVVARVEHLPISEHGGLAGPGERIATGDPDADGNRPLLFAPVLALQSRKLATPGQVGPIARAADPCQRREDAYEAIERDGDAALYLMELLEAVENLRDEADGVATDRDRLLHPAARRHLASAVNAMKAARTAVNEATRFGSVCELIRGGADEEWIDEIEDRQPCDETNLYGMLVDLPGMPLGELACPVHAKLAEQRVPETKVRPNPHA
ncbi:hypothetical protein [Nonomuraea africana]|uniref:DUF222 domain-containing protein n=1 Tax=Nonomuraea africana TaxID=46171 RepID=A0ABR9KDG9_9ACTN|nr:hypothetical protein [Nonomuraea africana]MBE1560073.1 hypothetical protein [Nonomuraea africana]